MTINPKVRDALLTSVAAHCEAIETYTGQRAHLAAAGYSAALADAVGADPEEENVHLRRLLDRLEWFDEPTVPDEPSESGNWPRHDLPGILAYNLLLEENAAQIERDGYAAAIAAGDPGTARVFLKNLRGSEDGVLTIRTTQQKVKDQTLSNFLSSFNS